MRNILIRIDIGKSVLILCHFHRAKISFIEVSRVVEVQILKLGVVQKRSGVFDVGDAGAPASGTRSPVEAPWGEESPSDRIAVWRQCVREDQVHPGDGVCPGFRRGGRRRGCRHPRQAVSTGRRFRSAAQPVRVPDPRRRGRLRFLFRGEREARGLRAPFQDEGRCRDRIVLPLAGRDRRRRQTGRSAVPEIRGQGDAGEPVVSQQRGHAEGTPVPSGFRLVPEST